MPLEMECEQAPQLVVILSVHVFSGCLNKVAVGTRGKCVHILLKQLRILQILFPRKIEQRIAVIKERSRAGNRVGGIIDHQAKVSEMPVGIAYYRIEYQHISERLNICLAELLIIIKYRRKASLCYDVPDGHIGVILAGEQLAGGTKDTFPLR